MSTDHKTPKEKKSGKKPNLGKHKKTVIGGGLVAAVAIAGIISGIYIYNLPQEEEIFFYGIGFNPFAPDPYYSLFVSDFFSQVIMLQVAEGLFTTNFSDGKYQTIHNLATNSIWSPDGLNFTCSLKQGVKFHDGTLFNALTVKWNFDRIQKLIPMAGEYLWSLPDEGGWVINKTRVIDDYTVRFILNQPFAPLPSLLASPLSFMWSPTSTPEDDFIDSISKDLCGTGPFIFDAFEENVSLTLSRNPSYWGDLNIKIDKIKFNIIFNAISRLEAMKSKELSMTYAGNPWSNDDREMLTKTSGITVEYTDSMGHNYLFMNNKKVNTTMRKAISYAFNYSYYIEETRGKNEPRCRSPIPKQLPYSNWEDFDVPYYNITKARQTLIDANWNGTAGLTADDDTSPGNEWEIITNSSFPLARYDFSYINGSRYMEPLLAPLTEALKQIGVKIEPEPLSGVEFYGRLFDLWGYNRTMLEELYFLGYNAPYNDPHSVIHPLFTNKGVNDNFAQVNDTLIQQWIDETIGELNNTARDHLYYQIQKRLIEDIYPMLWIYNDVYIDAYVSNIRGLDVRTYFFKDIYFV